MRHDPEEVGGVRLAGPDGENLPARHLSLVRLAPAPCGASALDRLCDVDRRRCRGGRKSHAGQSFLARDGRAGRDQASSVLRLTIGQKAAKLNGAQML